MKSTKIRLADYWYPVTVFGPGKKLGVWMQGCSQKCKECISPEYQSYDGGTSITIEKLMQSVAAVHPEGLVISGGEPFNQPEALWSLVKVFNDTYGDDIIVYTGYTSDTLMKKENPLYKKIISSIAVLIDGEYIPELNTGTGLAGSSNQNIHIYRHHDIYRHAECWERQVMCVLKKDGTLWMIGVPPV